MLRANLGAGQPGVKSMKGAAVAQDGCVMVEVEVEVEVAQVGDLPAVAAIYGVHVRRSASSFDLEPPPLARWEQAHAGLDPDRGHHLLVARSSGAVLGWAKSGAFRDRAAYASSVEVSVYVDPESGGRGIGGALYRELFALLGDAPVHRAYAGITQPNPASVALHLRHDFHHVGTYSEVGRKFDRWWDVAWYERPLPR